MDNKLLSVISFASIFMILVTTYGWISTVIAQGDLSTSNSSLGTKTQSIGNSSLIITPWNTGNDRNNGNASSIS